MGMYQDLPFVERMLNPISCVHPHPPITRALRFARDRLVAAGIKVVDWEPYKHQHGWEVIVS